MHSSATPQRAPQSPELRRRLRARARRVKILRRRVGALTLALLVGLWLAIAVTGSLGHSTSKVSVIAAVTATKHAHAATGAGEKSKKKTAASSTTSTAKSTTTPSSATTAASSAGTTASGTASAVTTAQS
jgi:hypothetical protein